LTGVSWIILEWRCFGGGGRALAGLSRYRLLAIICETTASCSMAISIYIYIYEMIWNDIKLKKK